MGVFHGLEPISAATTDFNAMAFIAQAAINRTATTTLVLVVAVDAAAKTVDINPMVAQLDGVGNATPHGVIHGVPYMRLQGGPYAVIIDPTVGDIGIAVFASHDLSAVKASRAPANPGSRRRFSMADALYIGGVLNGEPEFFVKISADGIAIKATTIAIDGDVTVTGSLVVDGEVTGAGIELSTHAHSGVTAGASNTGPPV